MIKIFGKMRYHWQPELSWLITYWSIALAPMFIAFSLLFERTKIPNHFFVLFATFVILVGLGFHRYFIIEDDGKLRIVALNPFRRSRVAIAQIQTIEVNKSGIVMKIKNQPDRIFYMRKWPKRPLLLPPPEKTACLRFVPAGESAFWASSCAISISSRA